MWDIQCGVISVVKKDVVQLTCSSLCGAISIVQRGGGDGTGRRRRQHSRQTASLAQTTGGDEAATGRRRGGDGDNRTACPM
eukprot:1850196-Pyramimonas_sp.AAC.1